MPARVLRAPRPGGGAARDRRGSTGTILSAWCCTTASPTLSADGGAAYLAGFGSAEVAFVAMLVVTALGATIGGAGLIRTLLGRLARQEPRPDS